jgi:lipid-binding SYLF domain-containing protein
MNFKLLVAATAMTCGALLASPVCFAFTKVQLNSSADQTIRHFDALNPADKALYHKAAGVLIFSRVTKGGAGVGGEFGEGVLRVKGRSVDYYSIGSASVGLTLGVGRHSEIIMFMTQESLDKFTASDGWSVGADAAVALVAQGAAGQYDAASLDKPILGFVFGEKGLLGDLSIEGSKISKIKT